ncbi:MAG: hypothetical protein JXR77_08385 [Lentisphaeria bacterium]|nr:hypothetical protein [Lentisphaeria bacterium]
MTRPQPSAGRSSRARGVFRLWAAWALGALSMPGAEPVSYSGDGADLQRVLDEVPEHALVRCDPAQLLTLSTALVIRQPMVLQGLHARLPEKLGRTSLIEVKSEGVTLLDLDLQGNYDSVSQDQRHPLIWIARGGVRVERCRFRDGTKDGIMITPEAGRGDLVGGLVRDIEALRMGRDAVSISGGNQGAVVRNVTVENVVLKTGFHRGAVEVSDGTENITVRHVRAEGCVYAVDVQDHGKGSAANVNVVLEDLTAVDCTHIVRTVNSPRGHANLILRGLAGVRCKRPVAISNTENVILNGLRLEEHARGAGIPVDARNCTGVRIRGIEMTRSEYAGETVHTRECRDVSVAEEE